MVEMMAFPAETATFSGQEVIDLAARYLTATDLALVEKALVFAKQYHKHQKRRKTGEAYISHPIQVAGVLAALKCDATVLAASFLHDVVEDTETPIEEIASEFGPDVAFMVDALTKISLEECNDATYEARRETQRILTHQKLDAAMAKDPRIGLIKLSDRLHNMFTLFAFGDKKEKQQRIAQETLDYYVPLAEKLGAYQMRRELEERAFRYLYPAEHAALSEQLQAMYAVRDAEKLDIIDTLTAYAKQKGMDFAICAVEEQLYTIYKKMQTHPEKRETIQNLIMIRCVVATEAEVYQLLDYIRILWQPLSQYPTRDYIQQPLANHYQAIHETVQGDKGLIKFLIKTQAMHDVAEYGKVALGLE